MSHPFSIVRKAVVLSCMTGAAVSARDLPDLVPMPKRYEPQAGPFVLGGAPLHIEAGNRQCALGAEDVAARIAELGGTPGPVAPAADPSAPGVHILTVASPVAAALLREFDLVVTAEDPGPQGYVIHPAGDRLLVIGSDSIGALYGAMTLRQMLRADEAGAVAIAPARVRDWPDYRYRSEAVKESHWRRGGARRRSGLPLFFVRATARVLEPARTGVHPARLAFSRPSNLVF